MTAEIAEIWKRLDGKAKAMDLAGPPMWPDRGLGHVRPLVQEIRADKRFVLAGERVLTFNLGDPFLVLSFYMAQEFFGEAWIKEQARRQVTDTPIVVDWLRDCTRVFKSGGKVSLTEIRSGGQFLHLGFNLFILANAGLLSGGVESEIRERLQNRRQFQGAYYELLLARIFLQAGFRLEWDQASSGKRVEFFATSPLSGQRLAVEAKARARGGVFGADGSILFSDKSVMQLVNAGRKKDPPAPLLLFVDANLPSRKFETMLHPRSVLNYPAATPSGRPFILFITNLLDGYGEGWVEPRMNFISPRFPTMDPSGQFSALRKSIADYPRLPEEFEK